MLTRVRRFKILKIFEIFEIFGTFETFETFEISTSVGWNDRERLPPHTRVDTRRFHCRSGRKHVISAAGGGGPAWKARVVHSSFTNTEYFEALGVAQVFITHN